MGWLPLEASFGEWDKPGEMPLVKGHQMKFVMTLAALAMTAGLLIAAEGKIKEGSCCDKAKKAGKECKHPCCVEAAKDGKVCAKCNKA